MILDHRLHFYFRNPGCCRAVYCSHSHQGRPKAASAAHQRRFLAVISITYAVQWAMGFAFDLMLKRQLQLPNKAIAYQSQVKNTERIRS